MTKKKQNKKTLPQISHLNAEAQIFKDRNISLLFKTPRGAAWLADTCATLIGSRVTRCPVSCADPARWRREDRGSPRLPSGHVVPGKQEAGVHLQVLVIPAPDQSTSSTRPLAASFSVNSHFSRPQFASWSLLLYFQSLI